MNKKAVDKIAAGLREAIAIARGDADPATYRVYPPGQQVAATKAPAEKRGIVEMRRCVRMRGRKDPEGSTPKIEGERGFPAKERLDPDSPLRLAVVAAITFPDGSMSTRGLRKGAGRGRLVVERIGGKDHTVLAAIAHMREACRVTSPHQFPRNEPPQAHAPEPAEYIRGMTATFVGMTADNSAGVRFRTW
jgi:hypothetical protein